MAQKKRIAPVTQADIDPVSSRWRFDRRIPVTLLLALAVQTAGLVVGLTAWTTKTDSRLSALEQVASDNRGVDRRLSLVEYRLDTMNTTLERVDQRLAERR